LIYMDNAATTRVTESVLEEMLPYFTKLYGNPSSVHAPGREARKALEEARRRTAKAINAWSKEIYFTAGGSEADTWAIKGAAFSKQNTKKTFVTTVIEHKAVLNAAKALEGAGFTVKYVPVNPDGIIDLQKLKEAVDGDTFLVSVMTANNEVGTLQPVDEACAIAHEAGALFHTDAVQAAGCLEIDVKRGGYDLLSLSGHKLHAPKGVGALYIKEGTVLEPLVNGGSQERGRRGGTENLCGIVGLGKALSEAREKLSEHAEYVSALRDTLITRVLDEIPDTILNGDRINRLPGNANITFMGVDGEALLLSLDLKDIAVSAGSACTSGSVDPSHVLTAMGMKRDTALSSVRFSLNEENTPEEVDTVVKELKEIISRLRSMTRYKVSR